MVRIMLEVHNVWKSYVHGRDISPAVKDVSFTVSEGEIVTLLGPSGCGKTTVLRCVAGLETPDRGFIEMGGRTVFSSDSRINVPVSSRPVSMVFQSYAIWPHMTVAENIAYPLRVGAQKVSDRTVRNLVTNVLERMKIPELARRSAANLSGGQQQRVALARAIIRRPQLLLLDEPLSNLDSLLRGEMRRELRQLLSENAITVLYVTHDLVEAMGLSEKIVVMDSGKTVQWGSPSEVYEDPINPLVAQLMGATNTFEGTIVEMSDTIVEFESAIGTVSLANPDSGLHKGDRAFLAVRPAGFRLNDSGKNSSRNHFSCTIVRSSYIGEVIEYEVLVNGVIVLVRCPFSGSALGSGREVILELVGSECWLFAGQDPGKMPQS